MAALANTNTNQPNDILTESSARAKRAPVLLKTSRAKCLSTVALAKTATSSIACQGHAPSGTTERRPIHSAIAKATHQPCGQTRRARTTIQHQPKALVRRINVNEFLRPNRRNFARGSRSR
jgi:hypothetical protein